MAAVDRTIRTPSGQLLTIRVPEEWGKDQIRSALEGEGVNMGGTVAAQAEGTSPPQEEFAPPSFLPFLDLPKTDELSFPRSKPPGEIQEAAAMGDLRERFTGNKNFIGAGELLLHLTTALPVEAMKTIGGATFAIDSFFRDDPLINDPLQGYLDGVVATAEGLEDKFGIGPYEPRTPEGKWFQQKFNEGIHFLMRGEEFGEGVRKFLGNEELALGAEVLGDTWFVFLPFLGRKTKEGKVADNAIREAEKTSAAVVEQSSKDVTTEVINSLAPSEGLRVPTKPDPAAVPNIKAILSGEEVIGGARVSTEFGKLLTAGAEEGLKGNTKSNQRIFQDIADLTADGYYDPIGVFQHVKNKYGLTNIEIADLFRQTATESGRFLQNLSQFKKQLNELAKSDPELALTLKAMGDASKSTESTALATLRKLERTRRGGLTSQLKTAVRNLETAGMMGVLGAFDRVMAVPIRGTMEAVNNRSFRPYLDEVGGLVASAGAMRRLTPGGRKKLRELMEEHPLEQGILFGNKNPISAEIYGEMYLPNVVQTLQVFNRAQEHLAQRMFMEAALRDMMAKEGMNFNTVRPKDVPRDMVERAFDISMEKTFASRPKGKEMRNFIRSWTENPLLTIIQPFPRFLFANVVPFLGEFGPQSFLRLMSRGQRAKLVNDPAAMSRFISRATAGTYVFSQYLANAMKKDPSSTVTEVQVGDNFFDTRVFSPLTAPLMILAEAIVAPEKVKGRDVAEALTGMNRIGPAGFAKFIGAEGEDMGEAFLRIAGDYVGSFAVPLAQLKDVASGWSPDEAIIRDMRTHPFLGPILKNLPTGGDEGRGESGRYEWLDSLSPPKFNPLYPGAKRRANPWLTQLTGLAPKSKTLLERESQRLSIPFQTLSPGTGDAEIDNIVNFYWGDINDQFMVPALLRNPQYKEAGPAVRKKMFTEVLNATKSYAYMRLLANHPREGAKYLASNAISEEDRAIIAEKKGMTEPEFREQLQELIAIQLEPEGGVADVVRGLQ